MATFTISPEDFGDDEARLARSLFDFFRETQAAISLAEIERRIDNGTINVLLAMVVINQPVISLLGSTYENASREAVAFIRERSSVLPGQIGFRTGFEDLAADFRRRVDAGTVETVRRQVIRYARGVRPGINRARELRGAIGLSPHLAQVRDNFRAALTGGARGQPVSSVFNRRLLDRRFANTIERAIETGRPLNQASIDRIVQRYEERLLNYRASLISRSSILRTVNTSARQVFQSYEENTGRPVRKRWDVYFGPETRDSHAAIDGQEVALNELFTTGLGNRMDRPGDSADAQDVVNCNCGMSMIFDEDV